MTQSNNWNDREANRRVAVSRNLEFLLARSNELGDGYYGKRTDKVAPYFRKDS